MILIVFIKQLADELQAVCTPAVRLQSEADESRLSTEDRHPIRWLETCNGGTVQ